jgi:hypothetical protein
VSSGYRRKRDVIGVTLFRALQYMRAPHPVPHSFMEEVDTIPKPDGLGPVRQTANIEQNSIDFGRCSRKIGDSSTAFESLKSHRFHDDDVRAHPHLTAPQ